MAILIRIALVLALAGCATVRERLGVDGGRVLRASLKTEDGATIALWRWSPIRLDARRVFVVPELGFDHRLVAPLCARLRDAGYDVATLDGREITGQHGRVDGWDGWNVDVVRAAAAFRPDAIIGIGVGGRAALLAGRVGLGRVVVAVNVPVRSAVGNEALRLSLAVDGYNPRAWLARGLGSLLLATGRNTSGAVRSRLAQLAVPISVDLSADITDRMRIGGREELHGLNVRALASMKDNLVNSEDALPEGGRGFAHTRRLALLEGFRADYGHLDWLVDATALDEVVPAVMEEIEDGQ